MAYDHRMNPVGEPHLNRIKRLIEGRVRPESAVNVGKSVDNAYANPETEKQNRREIGLYFKERHGASPSMDGPQTGPKYKRRTEEEAGEEEQRQAFAETHEQIRRNMSEGKYMGEMED